MEAIWRQKGICRSQDRIHATQTDLTLTDERQRPASDPCGNRTAPPRLGPRTLRAGLPSAGVRLTTTRRGAFRSPGPVASPSLCSTSATGPSFRRTSACCAADRSLAAGKGAKTGGRNAQDDAGRARRPRIKATTARARAGSSTSMISHHITGGRRAGRREPRADRPGARRPLRSNRPPPGPAGG